MQSMRRFFCAWMNLKAGHAIEILCVGAVPCIPPQKAPRSPAFFQKSKSLCRGRLQALPQLPIDYQYEIKAILFGVSFVPLGLLSIM